MTRIRTLIGISLLTLKRLSMATLATCMILPASANADESGWSFRLTPYGWLPSTSLDTSIGVSPPTQSATDLFEILDFGILMTGEARKGDWGLIGEFNYLAVSDEFTFAGGIVRGENKLKGTMGGAAVAYRFIGDDRASADVLAGFRIWSLDAKLDFRTLPTVSRSTTFVDPIIGLRGTYFLTDDVFVSGLFNIGGFGAGSDFQWEAVGRISYRINDTISTGVGYRHLALDVSRGGLKVDATLSGPFVALDFNF